MKILDDFLSNIYCGFFSWSQYVQASFSPKPEAFLHVEWAISHSCWGYDSLSKPYLSPVLAWNLSPGWMAQSLSQFLVQGLPGLLLALRAHGLVQGRGCSLRSSDWGNSQAGFGRSALFSSSAVFGFFVVVETKSYLTLFFVPCAFYRQRGRLDF